MRPRGWRHGAVTELSRFPCRRRMYMPGSQTTQGGANPRADGPAPVAFCCHDGIGTPDYIAFAAHNLACTHPCQRFAGNLAAPTHDSGPVWDATPFTVMDSHLHPPAGLPAHRGSIAHPTRLLCTLRSRRRRRPRNTHYRAPATAYPDRTSTGRQLSWRTSNTEPPPLPYDRWIASSLRSSQ